MLMQIFCRSPALARRAAAPTPGHAARRERLADVWMILIRRAA
jgi:hypothetical protein